MKVLNPGGGAILPRVWSDRQRAVKILTLTALLLALCGLYARQATTVLAAWPSALAAGDRADGRELRFSLWQVSAVPDARHFVIARVVQVPVEGDARGLEVGDTVSLVGRYRAEDQTVVAEILEVHHLRWAKEALGWLGVGLALVAAPLGFRWRAGRLEERG